MSDPRAGMGLAYRRTKIVATLGPASAEPTRLRSLLQSGVDVVRVNMSHGEHAGHRRVIEDVRRAADELGRYIAVLVDLCGPKIRTGRFENDGIDLVAAQEVTVTTRQVTGSDGLIPCIYPGLAEDVQPGDRILLADGAMELRVLEPAGTEVRCRVVNGGRLGNSKGINLPGVAVSAPSMTEKDHADAEFAADMEADFVALSFVRRAEDIDGLRAVLDQRGSRAMIIAKIEKPEALEHIETIVRAANGLMVARGDLGVELPPEQVPVAQKRLIEVARAAQKPVIVATQMLESMIENPRPTRAEVTDVAYAVTMRTDAVMLSAETAVGAYPDAAVNIMDRVIRHTEADLARQVDLAMPETVTGDFGTGLAEATGFLTRRLDIDTVLVISSSGTSARTMCAARPAAAVVAMANDKRVLRRMNLCWGAVPLLVEQVGSENPNKIARDVARQRLGKGAGDRVLLIRGFHADPALNNPSVTVITLE